MPLTLQGPVGAQNARIEDTALVQYMLKQAKTATGTSYYTGPIDGRASTQLSAAIAAFKASLSTGGATGPEQSGQQAELRAGEEAWSKLRAAQGPDFDKLRIIANTDQLYIAAANRWTMDTAWNTLRAAPRPVGAEFREYLIQAFRRFADDLGIEAKVAEDRIRDGYAEARIELAGFTWIDPQGNRSTGPVPDAIWQEWGRTVSAVPGLNVSTVGRDWVANAHKLTVLARLKPGPEDLLQTFQIEPGYQADRAQVLAALLLVQKSGGTLTGEEHQDLTQLIDLIAMADPPLSVEIFKRWQDMKVGPSFDTLHYFPEEQAMAWLKQQEEFGVLIDAVGIFLIATAIKENIGILGSSVAGTAIGSAGMAAVTIDFLAGGAAVQAERELLDRMMVEKDSTSSVAGIPIPAGKSKHQFLFDLFEADNFTGPEEDKVRIAVLMERILIGQYGDGHDRYQIREEIAAWANDYSATAERMRYVSRLLRERTSPANLKYRDGSALARLKARARLFSISANLFGSVSSVLNTNSWNDLLVWLSSEQHSNAYSSAKERLATEELWGVEIVME